MLLERAVYVRTIAGFRSSSGFVHRTANGLCPSSIGRYHTTGLADLPGPTGLAESSRLVVSIGLEGYNLSIGLVGHILSTDLVENSLLVGSIGLAGHKIGGCSASSVFLGC